ncbi:hypothetical protein A4G99_11375 [Haladaptatus sp. R4]|uniref:hypothetical protein n=1 Tax=Haladaptatus sp. R4 TaxID=1679489 RepID=UPI0007B4E4CF|nr:hypothetical protein [Haladaptatus sp. R4]KZN23508.1 hypothetical protein A4G99_11375 [Haladaptatus sp. R4]
MTTTVTPSSTSDHESHWWILLLPGLISAFIATVALGVAGFVLHSEPPLSVSTLPAPITFVLGLALLTAPAAVAIGIHFDRKYVASVSEWKPRSEYVLLGVAMWFGIGIPFALLYLYRRHQYLGIP